MPPERHACASLAMAESIARRCAARRAAMGVAGAMRPPENAYASPHGGGWRAMSLATLAPMRRCVRGRNGALGCRRRHRRRRRRRQRRGRRRGRRCLSLHLRRRRRPRPRRLRRPRRPRRRPRPSHALRRPRRQHPGWSRWATRGRAVTQAACTRPTRCAVRSAATPTASAATASASALPAGLASRASYPSPQPLYSRRRARSVRGRSSGEPRTPLLTIGAAGVLSTYVTAKGNNTGTSRTPNSDFYSNRSVHGRVLSRTVSRPSLVCRGVVTPTPRRRVAHSSAWLVRGHIRIVTRLPPISAHRDPISAPRGPPQAQAPSSAVRRPR